MTKYLPAWFWSYCEVSQIHGLAFVNDCRGKSRPIRLALWTCTVLVLILLCIYYTVNLCLYYISAPTAIAAQTTSNISNFHFPSTASCVDINFIDYLTATIGDIDETSFEEILANFTNSGQLSLLQNQIENEILTSLLNLNSTSKNARPLNAAIVAASYAMLALIMDYDRGQRASTSVLNVTLPSVLPLVDIIQAYFDENNVDYRFLVKVVGTYLCRAMKLEFATNSVIFNSQCPTLDSIVWMGAPGFLPGSHVLCVNFGNTSFFDNMNAMVFVQAMPQLIYGDVAYQKIGLNLYFDLHGGQSLRDSTKLDALTATGFGTSAWAGIEALGTYVWLNRTAVPCSKIDQFSCAETTFFDQIVANRSCTSLMQFGIASKSTPCTRRYTAAEASEATTTTALAVWEWIYDLCPRQCEYTHFVSLVYPLGGTSANATLLNAYPQPVLFFTNTEYYLMDFNGFLSAFGGLIGWWIGASFVAVIHIFVFGAKTLFDRLWPKRAANSDKPSSCNRAFNFVDYTIIKYCREFSFISDLHGFTFLAKETNGFVALFWLLLLPFCIAFTFYEAALLVNTYSLEPVETDMFVQSNTTIVLNDQAVCVAIERSQLIARNQSRSITDFNQTLQNFIVTGQMDILYDMLQNETVDAESLGVLDERVMLMSYMMINAFADYDHEQPWLAAAAYNQTILDDVDLLTNAFVASDIDFFQLTKLSAAYVCQVIYQTKIFVNQFDPLSSSFKQLVFNPCLDLSKFTWSTANPMCITSEYCTSCDYLCAKLPTNVTTFTMPQDYVSAETVNDASIVFVAIDLRHGLGAFNPANFDSTVSVSTGGSSSGSIVSAAVTIVSESQQYNSSSAPCAANLQMDCTLACFFANVSAERNCWSLSDLGLAQRPAGMQPCMEHYNYSVAVAENSATPPFESLTLAECMSNACLPSCISRSYFFYTRFVLGTASKTLRVDLHQDAFVYVVYTSEPMMDATALFSAFGATLGFWIGGSIIAIIHMPVYAFSALFVHFCSATGRSKRLDWFLEHRKRRHDVDATSPCVSSLIDK